MTLSSNLCLGLAGLVFIIALTWRLLSKRYSLPCPTWLGWLVEMENPFFKSYRTGMIVERLGLAPGMTVLDLGCGPGRITIPIAQQIGPQGQVVAMDIQPGMLRRAEVKARAANLANIQFLHAAAGEGKLARNRFDRVALVTVLGEIPNQNLALQEVFSALRPGGILSVTEVIADPHFQSRGSILLLARQAGFQEKQFFGSRLAFTLNLEKPAGA